MFLPWSSWRRPNTELKEQEKQSYIHQATPKLEDDFTLTDHVKPGEQEVSHLSPGQTQQQTKPVSELVPHLHHYTVNDDDDDLETGDLLS